MTSVLRSVFALVSLPIIAHASDSVPGWLDARDAGASGSEYQTTAQIKAGSKQLTVAAAGDFKVGQGVMISKANIRYTPTQLWGTGERYQNTKPLNGSVKVRGYDGTAGSWILYVLDIAPSPQPEFRFSDDLGRTWQPPQPITNNWQKLKDGIEVKLEKRDWESGYVIAFGARDQLMTRIEKIEGNVLTLTDAANNTTSDAVLRHDDTVALQAAVDRALKERKKLHIPVGRYRLAHGIRIERPESMTVEGADSERTVLDISEGEGRILNIVDGTEAIIRNLRFTGFMGFDERDRAGELRTKGSQAVWGFALKPCHAMDIVNTRRVLVENCHATRMSGEAFVASSRSRAGLKAKPVAGFDNPSVFGGTAAANGSSEGITYLRCSVTDCARNAFNDVMCGGEFTTVQNCRIIDVGGCSWEGASRYVKITGCYIRNAGVIGMGNLGPANRDASFPDLGAGQHIVSDNVFEAITPYGAAAIRSSRGATQVIIRNNLFVNFNSSAVEAGGHGLHNEYPAANTTITGNIFDMTAVGQKPTPRTVIIVGADDTVVSDNQIYVRGKPDSTVTAIRVREPASNLIIHDNLIRSCGTGLSVIAGRSSVGKVLNDTSFIAGSGSVPVGMLAHQYRGWTLAWFRDGKPDGESVIDFMDGLTSRFQLKQRREMKLGDGFEVKPPASNWNIHDNTILSCNNPVVLDGHGGATALIKANNITRGDALSAKEAIKTVRGRFELLDNHIIGFDATSNSKP
jgi:hypothetical protein